MLREQFSISQATHQVVESIYSYKNQFLIEKIVIRNIYRSKEHLTNHSPAEDFATPQWRTVGPAMFVATHKRQSPLTFLWRT